MSSYIFIKNFYLEEIQQITQDYMNDNYEENATIEAEILMKNSRTYFVRFNEELTSEELLGWLNQFNQHKLTNERDTIIEGYQTINQTDYKFYFEEDHVYAINSDNETFKIEDFEELVPFNKQSHSFISSKIPTTNIHSMGIIKYYIPKKKWWKFW